VALFRAATLGQLSWTRTYAAAFAGFLIFKALATFRFTRAFFGPTAAVIATWIATLDPGEMLEGGWKWHTEYGVWPVTLSVSFALFAFVELDRVLERRRARDVLAAGAWIAAALLTHAVALLVFAVAAPILLLDHATRTRAARLEGAARVMGALAFGAALSAFYLVPFLTRGDETQDLGWLGHPFGEMCVRFVELRTFDNVWAPIHALAILGACFVVVDGHRRAMFFALSAGAFVLLSSSVLVEPLHLERAIPSLIKIEFTRMLLVAKLFWFPLAGYALLELPRLPDRLRLRDGVSSISPAARRATWLIALAAFALLVAPRARSFYRQQIEKTIQGEQDTPFWDDLVAFSSWARALERRPTDRIAYYMYRNNHLSTIAPVLNASPMYKIGYTPAQIFNKLPMTAEDELLEALSVKYVASQYELDDPKLVFERNFGDLSVYRFAGYRSDPFTVHGAGQAELLEFEPERVRIRLHGTDARTRVRLHIAPAANWEAKMAGKRVPIDTVPALGAEYPVLMEVPASDGELVLAYVRRKADWLGIVLSLGALPAFAGTLWLARRGWLSRLLEAMGSFLHARAKLLAGGVAALVGLVAMRAATGGVPLAANSIFRRLRADSLTFNEERCEGRGKLAFACGKSRVHADVMNGSVWGVHACMTASPDEGELVVRANLALGSFLEGTYDPPKDREGSIRVSVDGRELGALVTRPAYLRQQVVRFDTRAFQNREGIVEISVRDAALRCFDFRVVP
jgi:hypothetical protein